MEFKPATCPNCAGSLQVPARHDTVSCMYCGGTIVVREAIRAAAAAGVANWMKLGNVAARSGNFPEAYSYFTKILEVDPNNHEAWFGKGEATGWMAMPHDNRVAEMLTLFRAAVEHSPTAVRPQMITRTNTAIAVIALNAYRRAVQVVATLLPTDPVRLSHVSFCLSLLGLMDQAHRLAPAERQIVEGVAWVCNDVLTTKHYALQHVTQYGTSFVWVTLQLTKEQRNYVQQVQRYYNQTLRQLPPGR